MRGTLFTSCTRLSLALIAEERPAWEAASTLTRNSPCLMERQGSSPHLTRVSHRPLSWARRISLFDTLQPHFPNIRFSIIVSYTCRFSESFVPFKLANQRLGTGLVVVLKWHGLRVKTQQHVHQRWSGHFLGQEMEWWLSDHHAVGWWPYGVKVHQLGVSDAVSRFWKKKFKK
jgi:hypothetical protein